LFYLTICIFFRCKKYLKTKKWVLTSKRIGWNTWNTFKTNFNHSTIEDIASKLVSTGLARVGYKYVVLDEGWQALARDSNRRQQPNATKFPSGISALADYVHKLGLKLGIYR